MKVFKTFLTVSLTLGLLLILYINMATVTTTYTCEEDTSPLFAKSLQIKVDTYHPWTKLWSDSIGQLSYDIPLQEPVVFNQRINTNANIHLYEKNNTNIQGSFTKEYLVLDNQKSTFRGQCFVEKKTCVNGLLY